MTSGINDVDCPNVEKLKRYEIFYESTTFENKSVWREGGFLSFGAPDIERIAVRKQHSKVVEAFDPEHAIYRLNQSGITGINPTLLKVYQLPE